MKTKALRFLFTSFGLILMFACSRENNDEITLPKSSLDTLVVPHETKGYELYSWPEGNNWFFSVLGGTNRIKTYEEVMSNTPTSTHLITVSGLDTLKLVLAKFPENEYITWIGEGWLQSCWGGNYGNLQLPPQNYIDEVAEFCLQKKLNLQITE